MAPLCHGSGTAGRLLSNARTSKLGPRLRCKEQEPKGGLMILCRKCRWVGVTDDLKWGACPGCGGRKFQNNVEMWADRVGWGMFVTFLAYLITRAPLTLWMR